MTSKLYTILWIPMTYQSPSEVKTCPELWMLKDLLAIQSIKLEKGISMGIILKELTIKLMNADLPSKMKGFLIKRMAELE